MFSKHMFSNFSPLFTAYLPFFTGEWMCPIATLQLLDSRETTLFGWAHVLSLQNAIQISYGKKLGFKQS